MKRSQRKQRHLTTPEKKESVMSEYAMYKNIAENMPSIAEESGKAIQVRMLHSAIQKQAERQAFNDGYNAGFKAAAYPVIESYYASVAMALKEEFGFGKQRIIRTMKKTEENLIHFLTSKEAVDQAFITTGVEIDLSEPFDRLKERQEEKHEQRGNKLTQGV